MTYRQMIAQLMELAQAVGDHVLDLPVQMIEGEPITGVYYQAREAATDEYEEEKEAIYLTVPD